MKKLIVLSYMILLSAAVCFGEVCHYDLPGDVDGNCRFDLADFGIMAQAWLVDCEVTPDDPLCVPLDIDGDGFDVIADCDDNDPGAPEIYGDGIDQDCDGSDATGPAGMVFVAIPGGTFQMGDSFNGGEPNSIGDPDEIPVHTVTLSPFEMSKYEITNAQYAEFLNSAYPEQIKEVGGVIYAESDIARIYPFCSTSASSSYSQIDFSGGVFTVRTKGGRDMSDDPVVMVSWYGAVAFCSYYGYVLPTEAQWEYAARGGIVGNRFPWGDTISHSQANYNSSWLEGSPLYYYDVSPTEGYHPAWDDGIIPYTSPAGSFDVNGYGLHDMTGNVWEWCGDWYGSYSSSSQINPIGPISGTNRVIRGGGWYSTAKFCRVANRSYAAAETRVDGRGFRVCR